MNAPTHAAGAVSANRQTYEAKRAGDRARYAKDHDAITATRRARHAERVAATPAASGARNGAGPSGPPIAGAVAYIRRSVARRADPGDISREFQTDAVRKLANGDGAALRILDGDWGRSAATEKTDHRLVFLALMEAVEAGRVTAVYAYSADRLARSIEWSARMWNACARNATIIVTTNHRFDPADKTDTGGWSIWHYEAVGNEAALQGMIAKSNASAVKRKERGDVIGRAPYGYQHAMIDGRSQLVPRDGEDVQTVVAAFEETGTYNGAARLLRDQGVPTRFGHHWDATAVRRIYLRERPEAAPLAPRKGSASRGRRYFSGLLRCPHADLHPDTPILTTGGTAWGPRYLCRSARTMTDHPKPYIVSEAKVREWAETELARFPIRWDVAFHTAGAVNAGKIAKLQARRIAVVQNFEDGDISRDEKKLKLAKIDAEIASLEPTRRATMPTSLPDFANAVETGALGFSLTPGLGYVDFSKSPGEVNAKLRQLWDHVELDPVTLLPVKAVYHPGLSPEEQEAAVLAANEQDEIDAREHETTAETRRKARQRAEADRAAALATHEPIADKDLPF